MPHFLVPQQEFSITLTKSKIMKKLHYLSIIIIAVLLFSCNKIEEQNLAQKVNPFIGTGGHGHTYPGATLPFGMVQLSPDTRLEGWDGCGAYHYTDSILYGFSHTHLSGTGISDYADILLMPFAGEIFRADRNKIASHFKHDNETAYAGYYSVHLDDYNIDAELTTTLRCGIHHYKFNDDEQAKILLDLVHRDKVNDSYLEFIDNKTIVGYRHSSAWTNDQRLFFAMQFNKEFEINEIEFEKSEEIEKNKKYKGEYIKTILNFTEKDILVKVGISAVDIDGAKKNLEAEMPDFDFEKYKNDAVKAWNNQLSKITIETNDKNIETNFYTALYHTSIAPNTFSDVDGRYLGRDKNIHTADGFTNYTVFSLWDTYRATHPLFSIIERERTVDFIKVFIKQWEQDGQLPVWELAANETNCMIGKHAIPVIADAIINGIKGFDEQKAYQAMIDAMEQNNPALNAYRNNGFISTQDAMSSVSVTLEYAYDDWCIAKVAKHLGKDEDYKKYIQRAQFYKNIYDPETKFMRPRTNGAWKSPFNPAEVDFNYTEANSWQYSFYVPQDVQGLIEIMGGNAEFEKQMDALFTADSELEGRHQSDITGLIGQYAHGNEPSHHMAYLYNYIGKPYKTQKYTSKIMQEMYLNSPDGLIGNEDCGQMSAWYVFSAMGFYPVTPASGDYIIGSPLVNKAEIKLENGNTFKIIANNLSKENNYIQSATLNGNALEKSFITHEQIQNGGELIFEMGSEPNKEWGSEKENIPVSKISDEQIVTAPWLSTGKRSFSDKLRVDILSLQEDVKLYYALNDNDFQEFTETIIIDNDSKIRFYSENKDGKKSTIIESEFKKLPENMSIKLENMFDNQYTGGGYNALIDGIKGGYNFADGTYQGFNEKDLIAIIDLGEKQQISSVNMSFIQDINSWIFMPEYLEVYTSVDGKNFKLQGKNESKTNPKAEGSIRENIEIDFNSTQVKFIKVKAKNLGKCPEWHKGYAYDGKAWVFADEVGFE